MMTAREGPGEKGKRWRAEMGIKSEKVHRNIRILMFLRNCEAGKEAEENRQAWKEAMEEE